MEFNIDEKSLYNQWLDFTKNRNVVECTFSAVKDDPLKKLVGAFAPQRLTAFGRHASASVIAFYSKKDKGNDIDKTPLAWLDSEGSPNIVISNNLKEFLSIIPYGMEYVYDVAAFIERNLNDAALLEKVKARFQETPDGLIEASKNRFLDVDEILQWLDDHNIPLSKDPVQLIVRAHENNNDLSPWIKENK